jgi:23S rRNA (uracil1939-C5)-methyltransferase
MVVLVTSVMDFPKESQFINALLSRHPEITTIVQNVNNKRTSLVLGEESRVLFGSGYIEEELCGLRFRISPKAFYQIFEKISVDSRRADHKFYKKYL